MTTPKKSRPEIAGLQADPDPLYRERVGATLLAVLTGIEKVGV